MPSYKVCRLPAQSKTRYIIGVLEECDTFHSCFKPVTDVGCRLPSKSRYIIGVLEEYVTFHSSFNPVSDVAVGHHLRQGT